jgi:hypothetical protein
MSAASILNRLFKEKQEKHWSRPTVRLLSESLYEEDPWGLRGFGVPSDEYEWLAELCVSHAIGLDKAEDLWLLEEPLLFDETSHRSLDELYEILQALVNSQNPFGDQGILIPRHLADTFSEALDLLRSSPGNEESL